MKKIIFSLFITLGTLIFLQCSSKNKQTAESNSNISDEETISTLEKPIPYVYDTLLDSNLYVVSIKDSYPYTYGLLQWNQGEEAKLLIPVKYRQLTQVKNSSHFFYLVKDSSAIIWDTKKQAPLCNYPFVSISNLEYVGQDKGEHVFLQASRIGAYYQLVYEKGKVYQLWGVDDVSFKNNQFYIRSGVVEDTLNLSELYSKVQSLCQPYASEGKLLERIYMFKHNGLPTSMLSFHVRFPNRDQLSYKPVRKWIRNFLYLETSLEDDEHFQNIPSFNSLTDEQALDSLGYHVVGYLDDMSPEERMDYPFWDCPFGQFFIDIAWKKGALVTYLVDYSMFYGGKIWSNHTIYVTFNLNQGKLLEWDDLIPTEKEEEFIREMNKYAKTENLRRFGDTIINQDNGIYHIGIISQGLTFEKAPQNDFIEPYLLYLYKCDISSYLDAN